MRFFPDTEKQYYAVSMMRAGCGSLVEMYHIIYGREPTLAELNAAALIISEMNQ